MIKGNKLSKHSAMASKTLKEERKMTEETRVLKLGEILSDEQLAQVVLLLNAKDHTELRSYLNTFSDELLAKGIIADWLYYYLIYSAKS